MCDHDRLCRLSGRPAIGEEHLLRAELGRQHRVPGDRGGDSDVLLYVTRFLLTNLSSRPQMLTWYPATNSNLLILHFLPTNLVLFGRPGRYCSYDVLGLDLVTSARQRQLWLWVQPGLDSRRRYRAALRHRRRGPPRILARQAAKHTRKGRRRSSTERRQRVQRSARGRAWKPAAVCPGCGPEPVRPEQILDEPVPVLGRCRAALQQQPLGRPAGMAATAGCRVSPTSAAASAPAAATATARAAWWRSGRC